MEKDKVSIKDVNATANHDFPFALGAKVNFDKDGNKGTVEDAIWEGYLKAPATHYTITYQIRTPSGEIRHLKLNEILGLNKEQ
ncbi:MAG: hypothetical protein AABN95_05115 [Acidobacteriota bacterium]